MKVHTLFVEVPNKVKREDLVVITQEMKYRAMAIIQFLSEELKKKK